MKNLLIIIGVIIIAVIILNDDPPPAPAPSVVVVNDEPRPRIRTIHRTPEDPAIVEARIRANYYAEVQRNWIAYQEMVLRRQEMARQVAADQERERQFNLRMDAYERQSAASLNASLNAPFYVIGTVCGLSHSHSRFCH